MRRYKIYRQLSSELIFLILTIWFLLFFLLIILGYIDGGKDTCQGDSGSSIFIDDSTKSTYVAIGIVSYGEGCAKPNKPGIYTKISSYLPWINGIMLK